MMRASRLFLVVVFLVAAVPALASDLPAIRVGVLKFGTVNWELDVIRHHGLDRAEGIDLKVTAYASKQATAIALQGGAVDVIVTDWFWVSRLRSLGTDYTFAPYSTSVGALVVPAGSNIRSLADLAGKRIGIAGGPIDKSWLLFRALARKRHGMDLEREADAVFAAAPLLNEQIKAGRLDAVVTFWHYVARLETAGMHALIGIEEVTQALGIDARVPLLGYVFRESWAEAKKPEVLAFLRVSRQAKEILRESDAEWERLRSMTRAADEETLIALRESYRAGIPESWGEVERGAAVAMFDILKELAGEKLVGPSGEMQAGTFWPAVTY